MKRLNCQKNQKILFLCALLLFFVFSSVNNVLAQKKSNVSLERQLETWKNFNLANGAFRVDFPAEPEQSIFVTGRENTLKIYWHSTDYSTYGAIYGDLPKDSVYTEGEKRDIFQEIFANLGDFYQTKLGNQGTVLSERDLTSKGLPGRELELSIGASQATVQVYYANNKFYVLIAGTPFLHNAPADIVKIYEAEAAKFFNSFQIMNNRKTENIGELKTQ